MAVVATRKRKSSKAARKAQRKAKPEAAQKNCDKLSQLPASNSAPNVFTGRRRKLVNYQDGRTLTDTNDHVITWDENDPEAEAALLTMAASERGWCLVPQAYRYMQKGAEGMVWR
jgi:hypothetical protein